MTSVRTERIEKLNGKNYLTWVVQMKAILVKEGSWKAVALEPPVGTNPSAATQTPRPSGAQAGGATSQGSAGALVGGSTASTLTPEAYDDVNL